MAPLVAILALVAKSGITKQPGPVSLQFGQQLPGVGEDLRGRVRPAVNLGPGLARRTLPSGRT